jgi:hypothetical protein
MFFSTRWLLLPVRAPMLTLLGLISFYLGAHWGFLQDGIRAAREHGSMMDEAYFIFSLAQVFILVFFCTLPDLVLRQLSLLMAASKIVTLVVTLLVVIVGGMYLLYMPGFVDLLVLAAALLLARLDLVRLRIWPPSWLALTGFMMYIMFFVVYGHAMHLKFASLPWLQWFGTAWSN